MSTTIIVVIAVIAVSVFAVTYLLLAYKPPARTTGDIFLQMQKSDSAITASTVSLADRFLSRASRQKLSTQLSVAEMKLRPAEWRALQASAAVVLGIVGALLFNVNAGVIGFLVGPIVLTVWLRRKISKVRTQFVESLADTLQLLAGSLRSGLSLAASITSVATEGKGPIQSEFNRVLSQARLNIPIEESLDEVAERMQSQDFAWVALSVRIQKEVGSDLAGVLTTTAETIRERAYLHRQVQSMSAEGRFQALVLLALPLLVTVYMLVFRYDYFSVMWTTGIGALMSITISVMMVVGFIWMKKTSKVEV